MAPANKTWSLFFGIGLIAVSLGVLHQFCDGYSESILTRPVVLGARTSEVPAAMPAGLVCTRWLGPITKIGGVGVAFLLAAWLVPKFSGSKALLQFAKGLAIAGRLIALGSLGTVVLVLVLFTQFADIL